MAFFKDCTHKQLVKPSLRGVSHQIACFIAILAAIFLSSTAQTARIRVACLVYTIALVVLFGISAIYHRITWQPNARRWMRRLDHATIFIFIAGTYTPICMLALPHDIGHALLQWVWIGAIAGVMQSLLWVHAPRFISASLYIALGWIMIPYWQEFVDGLGERGIVLIMLGGLSYILGAIIYATRQPNPLPTVFGYHEIFHLLVIVASGCHFAAIYELIQQYGLQA